MATHDIGDTVRLWVAFFDEAGAQADPDTVTLDVEDPAGVVTQPSVTAAEAGDLTIASASVGVTLATVTGVYKAAVDVDQAGHWEYAWYGVGTVDERDEGWFQVRRQRVGAFVP
jgi:hypothetical protein